MRNYCRFFLLLTIVSILITPLNALAVVDPQCTDGECSEYIADCWNSGREVISLDADTDHCVTLCVPFQAASTLAQHHPFMCRGTCNFPTVCYSFGDPADIPTSSE